MSCSKSQLACYSPFTLKYLSHPDPLSFACVWSGYGGQLGPAQEMLGKQEKPKLPHSRPTSTK